MHGTTGKSHGRRYGGASALSRGRSTASAAQAAATRICRGQPAHMRLLVWAPHPHGRHSCWHPCAHAPCPPGTRSQGWRALDSCEQPERGAGACRQGWGRRGRGARRRRAPAHGRRGGRARRARAARCRTRRTSPRPRAASPRSAAAAAAARPPGSAARWPRRTARRRRRPPSTRPPAAAAPPPAAAPWPPAGARARGVGYTI